MNRTELVNAQNKKTEDLQKALAFLEKQMESTDLDEDDRAEITRRIDDLRQKLKLIVAGQQIPETSESDMTIRRLDHLRDIFLHYCTHIFRVGRHMTFQRLQYEKEHMTLDRFFVFLRDFRLTTIEIDNKPKQIVKKTKVMNIFRKLSTNSKDITFEQFIQCLEKIAIVHYDEGMLLQNKEQTEKQKPIKKANKKKTEQVDQRPDRQTEPQPQIEPKPQQEQRQQKQENEQLLEPEIEQSSIQPKNEESESAIKHFSQFNDSMQPQIQQAALPDTEQPKPSPFSVPITIKIQQFYRRIGVDSIAEYKKKLGQLNLPIFKPIVRQRQSESNIVSTGKQEEEPRSQFLRERLEEQKALDIQRRKSPKKPPLSTEKNDYYLMVEDRKLKRQREKQKIQRAHRVKEQMEEEAMRKMLQLPPQPSKKIPSSVLFRANNVTWNDIEKLNFQQVNPHKNFHPHQLYDLDAEDEEFMGDLKFDQTALHKHHQLSRHRPFPQATTQQLRAQNIVKDVKRRISQLEAKDRRNPEIKTHKRSLSNRII